jgi:hypothetical protein
MPLPNLDNRASFKNYVRHFKNKFTSQIQDVSLSQIEGILTSKSSGLGDVPVKFVIFDNWDTVDVSSLKDNQEYIYIPGLPGDNITLKIDNTNYDFTFIGNDTGISYGGTTYTLDDTINLSGSILTVKGLGGALIQLQNGPTYSIAESSTSINEGDTVSFTITTTDVPDGTTLYYTTSGTVSPEDFSDLSLSESFNISSGIATISRSLLNDFSLAGSENQETFQIQIRTDSVTGPIVATSSTVTVQDTSTTSYSITESINSVNEGENITFTINTTGVPDGTNLYYTSSSSEDVSPHSGSFVINNDTGSFIINAINDLNVEADETFNVQIRTGSTSGGIVTTSNNITIANVPYSLSISSAVTVTEGNSINFTINTTGIPNSTVLYFTTSGISTADIPIQSGSFTISNNTGTISLLPVNDFVIDDNESFTLQIRAGSITGSIIATSTPVIVKDRPYTISITPSTTSIVESTSGSTSTLTFNISTTNVNNGTNLKAKITPISGNISVSDFNPSSFERSFTVTGSTISFSWVIVRDAETEGDERFALQILDSSNNVIATSPTITILDRSFIGSRHNKKTYGPIRVSRDNGYAPNASDWFDICNLDSLPDGSKIALFIDNSGSMTTDTVRASYNLLVEKLNQKNMEIIVVENANENWITPFNTILD